MESKSLLGSGVKIDENVNPIPKETKITYDSLKRILEDYLSTSKENLGKFFSAVELAEAYAFQGFDPNEIHAEVMIKTKGKYAEPVRRALAWLQERGGKISGEKVEDRTTEEGYRIIAETVKLLGIENTNEADVTDRKVITLPRLAATYPHIMATIIANTPDIRIVGNPGQLPKALCFSGGASLIPKSEKYENLFHHFLRWSKTFDEQINSNGEPNFARVCNYASISRSQSPITDEQRIQILNKLGINNDVVTNLTKIKDPRDRIKASEKKKMNKNPQKKTTKKKRGTKRRRTESKSAPKTEKKESKEEKMEDVEEEESEEEEASSEEEYMSSEE
jgi:hypothetical protein